MTTREITIHIPSCHVAGLAPRGEHTITVTIPDGSRIQTEAELVVAIRRANRPTDEYFSRPDGDDIAACLAPGGGAPLLAPDDLDALFARAVQRVFGRLMPEWCGQPTPTANLTD